MVEKIELYLSNLSLKDKPNEKMVKRVSNSMLKNPVELPLEEFARQHTVLGKTAVLSRLPDESKKLNKDTPIISQQVVMLDFDNKEKENLFSIADFYKDEFLQKNCTFWYRTLSDKLSDTDRFRVVFVLDTKVRSNIEIEVLYLKLFSLYPQADTSCAETTRMFFGTTEGYEVINWYNRLSVNDLHNVEPLKKDKKNRAFPTTRMTLSNTSNTLSIPEDRPVWQLLSDTNDDFNFVSQDEITDLKLDTSAKIKTLVMSRKKAIIKKKIGRQYAMNFNNKASAVQHFKQNINMVEFLELPKKNFFKDIFHDEVNPSANVFISNKGEYLYKCFSSSHKFLGNIVNIVRKLTNKNYLYSVDLLLDLTGSKIIPDTYIATVKSDVDMFEDEYLSEEFQSSYPYTYRITKLYRVEIILILNAISKKDIEDLDGNRRVISFLSLKTLQNYIYNRAGFSVSTYKLSKIINIMTVLGLMNKLDAESIPKHLMKSLKEHQRIKQTKTYADVYELVPFSQTFFEDMEDKSKICIDNNVKVATISFEMLVRTFGLEFAKSVYTQTTVKDETGTGTPLSKKSVKIETKATAFILETIEQEDYVFEKDVLKHIMFVAGSKDKAKYYWKQMRHDVANKYHLERKSFTKDLKKRFNSDMPNNLHPVVYFKKDN